MIATDVCVLKGHQPIGETSLARLRDSNYSLCPSKTEIVAMSRQAMRPCLKMNGVCRFSFKV